MEYVCKEPLGFTHWTWLSFTSVTMIVTDADVLFEGLPESLATSKNSYFSRSSRSSGSRVLMENLWIDQEAPVRVVRCSIVPVDVAVAVAVAVPAWRRRALWTRASERFHLVTDVRVQSVVTVWGGYLAYERVVWQVFAYWKFIALLRKYWGMIVLVLNRDHQLNLRINGCFKLLIISWMN